MTNLTQLNVTIFISLYQAVCQGFCGEAWVAA